MIAKKNDYISLRKHEVSKDSVHCCDGVWYEDDFLVNYTQQRRYACSRVIEKWWILVAEMRIGTLFNLVLEMAESVSNGANNDSKQVYGGS
jgi:hypothetical protein